MSQKLLEQVFLSDDETSSHIHIDNNDRLLVKRKAKIELGISGSTKKIFNKKVHFEDDSLQIIEDKTTISRIKIAKESINEKINQLKLKFPVDYIMLRLKQANILLENKDEKEYLNVIVDPLIESLDLEYEVQVN